MPILVLAPPGIFMSTVNVNGSNVEAEQPVSHSTVSSTASNVVVFVQVTAVAVYRERAILKRVKETARSLMKDMAGAGMVKNIACLFFVKTALSTIGVVITITGIVVMPLPMESVDSALVTTIPVPSIQALLTNPSMHGTCMDVSSIQI